jgi:hypothetical protein
MGQARACELPAGALLRHYADQGAYADCYRLDIDLSVTHADYVEAFYTTPVFKLERLLLGWFVSRPSTDAKARLLALEQATEFAAWHVEARVTDQLLMCDMARRTRSWLMCERREGGGTTLYFGSAVVPVVDKRSGQRRMGALFRALLGFHRLYSHVLLRSAAARLNRGFKSR